MMEGVRRRAVRYGCGIALALGLTAGCAGSEERPADAAEAEVVEAADTEAAEADAGPAGGRAANGPAADGGAGEREEVPPGAEARGEPSTAEVATPGFEEPELRTYRLLLVNPGAEDAVIHASAGAARVVLDTVRAADSARVNVEVGSDRLLLEASTAGGRALGAEAIELSVGELSRWVVPAAD